MLWALGQPAAAAGLLFAFLIALGLRVLAIRLASRGLRVAASRSPLRAHVRSDVDPLGAVAAALGGTGWGRRIHLDETPRAGRGREAPPRAGRGREATPQAGRGRRALALAAGPCAVLLAGEGAFAAYHATYPQGGTALLLNYPSDVLRGAVAPTAGGQLLLSLGVGLVCFALLALL